MTSRKCTPTSTSHSRCCSTPSGGTVLGIDPGTTGMGFALLALDADPPRLITCGIVETPRGGSNPERLLAIATALDALIAEHAPSALAVERLYFNKNAKTAMAVAEARGIALLCGARARVEIAEYTPQQVKMAVTGNGSADKKAAQQLYGFETREELVLFEMLISVSNVGPRAALSLLAVSRPAALAAAIASGDVAALSKAPGVGKKTAERLIVDLKSKIARGGPDR